MTSTGRSDGPPAAEERPGGGSALLRGCSCEFAENRGGRGVGGIVVGIDQDGLAHRIEGTAYLIRKGCPVHAPSRPWWALPGLLLSSAGTSLVVTNTLDWLWLTPVPAGSIGFAAGIVAMLLTARWYDHCLERRTRG